MSFTVSATAARAVASPAFVSKASSKVRFVSFRVFLASVVVGLLSREPRTVVMARALDAAG